MSQTIRERDAEITPDEYGNVMGTAGQPGDCIAEDRRALLAAGDALAEATQLFLDVEIGWSGDMPYLKWTGTPVASIKAFRASLANWKAAVG